MNSFSNWLWLRSHLFLSNGALLTHFHCDLSSRFTIFPSFVQKYKLKVKSFQALTACLQYPSLPQHPRPVYHHLTYQPSSWPFQLKNRSNGILKMEFFAVLLGGMKNEKEGKGRVISEFRLKCVKVKGVHAELHIQM